MDIKVILWDFRYIILFLIIEIIYIALNWQAVKVHAYALMLQAKKAAKEGYLSGGKDQEEWVVKKLYPLLPAEARLFVSEEALRKIIHRLYIKSKDYLDDGEFNNSIKEGE